MPASTILVLESAATGAASLEPILTSAGYTVTRTTDPDEAFAKVAEHQLAVIDVGRRPTRAARTGFELCREIRATPSMAAVPILCVAATDDVEERIGFLEAGADDVIGPAIRRARGRGTGRGAAAPLPAVEGPRSRSSRPTDSRWRARGGRWPSTAPRAASGRRRSRPTSRSPRSARPDRVILVDLDLQFGRRRDPPQPRTEADHRRRRPRRGGAPRARAAADVRDPPRQRPARPGRADHAGVVGADHARPHLAHPHRRCWRATTSVVVDAGSVLDERALTVFEAAETIVLPVYPEISALKAMHGLLDYLNEAGVDRRQGDLRAQQHVRARHPQAARHRGGARHADHDRPAVRPVPLPQGGQRRCAYHAARPPPPAAQPAWKAGRPPPPGLGGPPPPPTRGPGALL